MNSEWTWLWQFLVGAFLAYYCMSPRLRHAVRELVLYFTPPPKRVIQPRSRPLVEQAPAEDPVRTTIRELLRTPPTVDLGRKSHIVTSPEKLEEWLRANPHLKVTEAKEK